MEKIFVKNESSNEEGEKPISLPLEVTVKQEIYENFVDNQKPVNILKAVNSDDIFKSENEVEVFNHTMNEIFVKKEPNNDEECEKPISLPLEVTVKQEIYEDFVDNQKPVNIYDTLEAVNSDDIFKSEIEVEEPLIFEPAYTEIPNSSKDVNSTIYHGPIKFNKKELLDEHVHFHMSSTDKPTSQNFSISSRYIKGRKTKNCRAKQSMEARNAYLQRNRQYNAQRRASESEQAREARLQYHRQHEAKRRASESEQERKARLQQMRQYAAEKLASESEEAREARLQQNRQYYAKKKSSESKEARNARLQQMRQYKAKREASESEEAREARLKQMRPYEADWLALQSKKATLKKLFGKIT